MYLFSESHKRQSVEVHIVSELLRHGVVLVVLDAPPGTTHAAAHAIQDHLQGSVHEDVTCSNSESVCVRERLLDAISYT